MTKGRGIALFLAFTGLLLAYFGFSDQELRRRLDATGKTTQGTVEGGEMRRGRRGSKTYHLFVHYTPEGQTSIRGDFAVAEWFYRDTLAASHKPIDVRYDPASPTEAIVEGTQDRSSFLPIGTGLFALGSIGFWYLRRRAAAQAG
jgi:hypothetical protein